jgi:hypothetical protein
MPRIAPLEREQAAGEARAAFDEGASRWGRMTNMKRTLLRSDFRSMGVFLTRAVSKITVLVTEQYYDDSERFV